MKGDTYLLYLRLYPETAKRPNFTLWGNLLLWVAGLCLTLWFLTDNQSLWQWAGAFLISVWQIWAIGFWSKLIVSKFYIDRELNRGIK